MTASPMTANPEPLHGRQILVVEDEYFLADDISRHLRARGVAVLGPAATLEEAARLLDAHSPDCAVLDVNLRGEMAYPLVDRLEAAGIPFLIATGYDAKALPSRFRAVPCLEKPVDAAQLAARLPELIALRQTA